MTDRPRSEWTAADRERERRALDLLYGKPNNEEKQMANDKQYDDTNRGAIFRNDNKTRDAQPDWSGPLNFEGVELRLAGWVREDRSGREFVSLRVERVENAAQKPAPKKQEDIPF